MGRVVEVVVRHLGFVTSLPAAILDLWWRHFRSPSWICGHVICGHVISGHVTFYHVTSAPEITWPEMTCHKSKMATGSDVTTNPRWRPEVTSQIQDGGPPPPPPVPRNVRPRSWQKCPWNVWKRSDQEVRIILFYLQFLSMDFFCILHRKDKDGIQPHIRKSKWTGYHDHTKCVVKVTISPGRQIKTT